MIFQLLLSFLLLINTGFSSDISLFVQIGDSVQLNTQTQLPEFEAVFWTSKKSEAIVRYLTESKKVIYQDSYKDRVDFNNKTFSLTLKNMQKADSGLYTARLFGETIKDIIKYNIYVIDEVEAPVLTVNLNCSSSELCSFTCSAHNMNISSIYNSSSCPEEEVTSADDHTLRLNCNATFIMCNYSNPLSWKTDIKTVHELMSKVYPDKGISEESLALWLIVVVFLVKLGFFAVAGIRIYWRRKGAEMNVQTVYEDVDTPSISDNSKSAGPVTIYCTTVNEPDQPKPKTETTMYAVVETH